ncbi:hypothetical protein [Alloprevotella tannerae]|jgi:hypothetical protein|uniref:hypothetical protein n=1 Tax=Alloprevotella tannerae TaxID=76122 RepID=UPI003C6FBDE3
MKPTKIYQTLEHRNNNEEIEANGPYFCSLRDDKGEKTGAKTPWLGEGYYFWDTRVEHARWWGKTIYENKGKGYVICETTYDAHSDLLYDLLGDLEIFDEFVKLAQEVKAINNKKVSFALVLKYLKEHTDFSCTYKAIRVWAAPDHFKSSNICFPKSGIYLAQIGKVQICFFDKTLLKGPFTVTETHLYLEPSTI